MAQDNCQKIKLLKLMELLRQKTDGEHPLTTMQLCGCLGAMGISCERRTLSKDIALLNEQGYEVMWKWVGKEKGYYIENCFTSIPEDGVVPNSVTSNKICGNRNPIKFTENLFRLSQLPIAVYDKHGNLEHKVPAIQRDYSKYEIDKREAILSAIKSKNFVFLSYDEKLPIGICGCAGREFDFVLGPFAYGKLEDWDARYFMKKKCIIPPFQCRLTDVLAVADLILDMYGEVLLSDDVTLKSISALSDGCLDEVLLKEEMMQYDSFQKNHDYIEEKYAMEHISKGDIGWLQDHRGAAWLPSYPVFLEDIKKNEEYIAVIVISLAARAAIQGGLTSQEGFLINDIYLKKISACTTVEQIHGVMEEAILYCANCVIQKKSANTANLYVEICKKVIASHKRDKINLDVIAKACGISKGYMQKLFREHEGISVTEYYIQIKMEAACSLLKFSDRSVREISEYLGFGSLSYFSDLFKRKTGLTPGQYRHQNKGTADQTK